MKGIIATLYRRKKYFPKTFFFETVIQNEVENCMADMGFGANQYYLSFGLLKRIEYKGMYPNPIKFIRKKGELVAI